MTASIPTTRSTAAALDAARGEGRAALIVYLPVGYPDVDGSIEAARTAVAAGADIVELGLPYSDPGMDGVVIQEAVQVALDAGTRTRDDRKSTRLNSSHVAISYAVFCLKKKKES